MGRLLFGRKAEFDLAAELLELDLVVWKRIIRRRNQQVQLQLQITEIAEADIFGIRRKTQWQRNSRLPFVRDHELAVGGFKSVQPPAGISLHGGGRRWRWGSLSLPLLHLIDIPEQIRPDKNRRVQQHKRINLASHDLREGEIDKHRLQVHHRHEWIERGV